MKVVIEFEFKDGILSEAPKSKTEWATWIDEVGNHGGFIRSCDDWKILYEECTDE